VIDVLFVQAQTSFGADSAVHAELMRSLDRDEFRVHVVCPAGDGPDKPQSRKILEDVADIHLRPTRFAPSLHGGRGRAALPSAALGACLDLVELRSYLVRNHVRIVHGSDRPRDAAYTVALAKLIGARSVVHVHVKWSGEYSAPSRWGVRLADACFGISRYVTETIVATGKPRERVHTVLNAIDANAWDPDLDGSDVRREFGITPDTPLLASVSRLFSWKGQRELLRALALVARRVPNVRLLIVGEDESNVGTGSFTKELRALASELGIAERVVFTGRRSDVARILAACDLFTLPSFEEPFGLVFLEAMAMRRPVVAIDNGGTPEVVLNGQTGLLSQPWDIDGLADNIVRLLGDSELRSRMGALGRERVIELFNPERMALAAAEAYRTVLDA
jgi:glycosyltransferase involved in cell wall biosynthesis